jgi:glycine/D-amino acid oxidase-like deaminating enzyme
LARVLIVGCGCRGLGLAAELMEEGHAIRATTRDPRRVAELESAGAEAWVGDPLRLASLTGALEAVTIACWLLGSAQGERGDLEALHGPRLRFFLERTVDTTLRGFVYEAAGTVDAEILAAGAEIAEDARRRWEIPVAVLRASPADPEVWRREAALATRSLLQPEGLR